jgi:hypothetical protein
LLVAKMGIDETATWRKGVASAIPNNSIII